MAEHAHTQTEERSETDPLDCGCNAERERRVAAFLVARLKDVEGVARIYSTREGGRIDFTVEVEDFWGEASSTASEAFYDLYGGPLGLAVETHIFPLDHSHALGSETTIWLEAS